MTTKAERVQSALLLAFAAYVLIGFAVWAVMWLNGDIRASDYDDEPQWSLSPR